MDFLVFRVICALEFKKFWMNLQIFSKHFAKPTFQLVTANFSNFSLQIWQEFPVTNYANFCIKISLNYHILFGKYLVYLRLNINIICISSY